MIIFLLQELPHGSTDGSELCKHASADAGRDHAAQTLLHRLWLMAGAGPASVRHDTAGGGLLAFLLLLQMVSTTYLITGRKELSFE